MNVPKVKRKFCWDDRGALEGLPLYLIILVVIAAVAIIIIFSYLSILRSVELDRIEVYIDGQEADPIQTTEGQHQVYIIAIGDDGNKLKDVTITMIGGGVNTAKKTDSNGRADFGSLTFSTGDEPFVTVQIEANYQGGNVDTKVTEELLVSGS